jgi:AsmA-like C-terminal region
MSEIRGEKLRFRKRDIVPLHALPSAQVEDPVIVHCPPPRRSILRRVFRVLGAFAGLWLVVLMGVYAVVESGALDQALARRAQAVLDAAVAPKFRAIVGSTEVRFSADMELTVEAHDVKLTEADLGQQVALTQSVKFIVEPLALIGGRFSVREVVSEGVSLDARLLPKREPFDLNKVRIDGAPEFLASAFEELDRIQGFFARGGLDRLRIGGLEVAATSVSGRPLTLAIDDIAMERGADDSLSIFGAISVNGQQTEVTALTTNVDGRSQSLTMRVADFRLTPFLLRRSRNGDARQGIDGSAELLLSARRGGPAEARALSLGVNMRGGTFYSDGQPQEITKAGLNFAYDFTKDTIEIANSLAQFDRTILPISGGLIDLDRLPEGPEFGKGFGIDLLVSDGRADVPDAGETAFPFSLRGYGRFLVNENMLQLDAVDASTPHGNLAGKFQMRFGGTGPEIRFNAAVKNLKTMALKQLWPYWIASKPRRWVLENIYGGVIPSGTIDVFIPQNRLSIEPQPVRLGDDELRIGLDVEDARMNLTGTIPPLRDVYGRIDMVGERVDVKIKSAGSYFPSGRVVTLDGGSLVLAKAYDKPLMADLVVDVSGTADALAELVSFKPIEALQRTEFTPGDLAGQVKGRAEARFGLIPDQKPPSPVWKASVDLDSVDVKKPFDGRNVTDVTGKLLVDPQAARLEATARVDEVPMDVRLTEPVGTGTDPASRERVISAKLDNAARNKLVPGLGNILDGPVSVELTWLGDRKQGVSVDMRSATLTVPWLGWSKGQGIGATAKFDLTSGDNNQSTIENFVLSGDGFGAAGDLQINRDGLQAANFSKVRLAPEDNVALTIRNTKGVYVVKANGSAFDARSLISILKQPEAGAGGDGSGGGSSGPAVRIEGQFDRVVGFANEALSGVSLVYSGNKGRVNAVDFSGVTGSGQAVVAKLRSPEGPRELAFTSSDVGSVVRFLDVYNRLSGGLANLRLTEIRAGSWSGNLDVRNVQVNNEERLQSIVSTPADAEGRSLNSAVRRDIDVSSARFQRAFARLSVVDGTLSVENGIVRGEQIGATFQGIVRDRSGRIDLTGTFMPAYGLNRLFGELPVIGAILGNGRDRGLLGITFKLTGPSAKPNLVINPLSIIAPGVFRQIFEFR